MKGLAPHPWAVTQPMTQPTDRSVTQNRDTPLASLGSVPNSIMGGLGAQFLFPLRGVSVPNSITGGLATDSDA